MILEYLLQYSIFVTLILLSASSVFMFRAQFKLPSILIGVSSFLMLILKFMHEISFSEELITNSYNEQGQIVGTRIDFTVWQSASFWVDPIGLIIVALGCLILSWQLLALNKKHQPTGVNAVG